jgi:uncharacterized membrane protein
MSTTTPSDPSRSSTPPASTATASTATASTATASTATAIRVVDALVGAGLMPPGRAGEARAVVTRTLGEQPAGRTGAGSRLAEIAGYAGGALVVAAVGLLVATGWTDLSETGQVVALGVITVVLAVAGLVAVKVGGGYAELRDGRDEVRRRLASALLVGAAVGAGATVARLVEVAGDEMTSWPALLGGLTALVLGGAACRLASSALVQLAMAGAAGTALLSLLGVVGGGSGTVLAPALALLGLGVGWQVLAEAGSFREPVVARFVGVGLALFGAQLVLGEQSWLAYLLTLAVAAAGFALYLRTVSWPYLVAGVLGITLVVPEAVADWTDGSLGIAGGVLVAGLALLGASLAGLRVRREATD